jgi:hypothetical protein
VNKNGDLFDIYRTHEWFESLAWQHRWIEFMVGWWVGTWGKPKTFVDFGAGDGWWSHSFKQAGAEHSYAVELDEVAAEHMTDDIFFIPHDLRKPWPRGYGKADLVMCLEVAEHLPKRDALNCLLPTLIQSTENMIVFSAAQPGQEGTGHVNLQPQFYWIEQFERHPYIKLNPARTGAAREAFERIVPEGLEFLPRNLLIFSKV